MKLLLSGLDTVECAYYLRAGPECKLDFAEVRERREFMRESKHPGAGVIELGGTEFLLSPTGTASGYPFRISNQLCSIQFGEFNNPSFFVTYRGLALAARPYGAPWAFALAHVATRLSRWPGRHG